MDADSIRAAQAFTRDLNILLKTVQVYGFDHGRTASAFAITWSELRAALEHIGEAGLLLGFSGSRILLDGVPIDGASADRSFAQWLSSAGLSTIHFSPRVTSNDLACFVRVFATEGPQDIPLEAQLKSAFAEKGEPAIRINDTPSMAREVVSTEARPASEVTALALRTGPQDLQVWTEDPGSSIEHAVPAEEADRSNVAEGICCENIPRAPAPLDALEPSEPLSRESVAPPISVEDSLLESLEAALRAPELPTNLAELFKRFPEPTLEQLASRLGRCKLRRERDRVVTLARALGDTGAAFLRRLLTNGPPQKAVSTIALLSWLEPKAIEEDLSGRLGSWGLNYHDQVIRQLASGGAPDRGKLLVHLLGVLDPVVVPEALDEIGICGDRIASSRLWSMLQELLLGRLSAFLGIKIVEALGRLRTLNACPLLRDLVGAKRLWRWRFPRELRITALQVLQTIDPDWTRNFLPKSGVSEADLMVAPLSPEPGTPWARQRRYERARLFPPLPGMARTEEIDCPIEIERLSLGGGVGTVAHDLQAGTMARFEMWRELGPEQAQILVRDAQPPQMSFELIQIELENRARIRRILTTYVEPTSQASVSPD